MQETLKNNELISDLKWESLVLENDKKFKTFISDLKGAVKNKIGQQKLTAQLSPEKLSQFQDSTNRIISDSFKSYDDIFVSIDEGQKDKDLRVTVSGARILMTKSGFTDNDIPHLNYDTVFASQIAKSSIEKYIPNSFIVSSTKRYLLNKENILLGIDKIIGNNKDVIIIAMNVGYEFSELLKASKYNSLIKYIPATDLRDLLFVLNKTDLPSICKRTLFSVSSKVEFLVDHLID